jgi:hypothetical protein
MRSRKTLMLYGANTTLGWRVVRMISPEEGERREATGSYRRVYDGMTNALLGFQIVGVEIQRGDEDLPTRRSSHSISSGENRTNAGLDGKSHTFGLAEDLRLERKVPEDHVERVQEKVRVYPLLRDKASIVRRVAAESCGQGIVYVGGSTPAGCNLREELQLRNGDEQLEELVALSEKACA